MLFIHRSRLCVKFSTFIQKTINNSFNCNTQSISLYTTAEAELLTALGLSDYQPSAENVQVKSLKDSFLSSGRLDAEFYQQHYYDAEESIKQHGFSLIKDICSDINYGTVPTSPYTKNETGIPYIKGLNLKGSEIVTHKLDRLINTEDLPEKFFGKKGDIVISQMGTVGNTGVITENEIGWLFASFTIRIRIKDQKQFNPYFLALYIEKVAKPYYLYRYIAQASVRQNTDLPTIKNMYVPNLSFETQTKISNGIQQSFKLKTQSKQLLHIAKTGVEKAIEESEAAAMAWMEAEIGKLQ